MDRIGDIVSRQFDKVRNPFAGSLVLSWLILNWQKTWTALFVSEERTYDKFELLKNEYAETYLTPSPQEDFWSFVWHYMIPFVFAFVYTGLIHNPVSEWIYRKKIQNANNQVRVELEEKIEIEEKKAEVTEARNQVLEQEIEREDQSRGLERRWMNDYRRLKQNESLFARFSQLVDFYYKHSGRYSVDITDRRGMYEETISVDSDVLSYAHSNDVIELDQGDERFQFTPKGKYFVSRYTADDNK